MFIQTIKNVFRISFFVFCFVSTVVAVHILQIITSVILLIVNVRWFKLSQQLYELAFSRLLISLMATIAGGQLIVSFPDEEASNSDVTEAKFIKLIDGQDGVFASLAAVENNPKLVARDLIICNHQVYVDWVYIWALMDWVGRAGQLKIILKESLKYIPFLGLGMQFFSFIFLKRSWDHDQKTFARRLMRLVEDKLSFCLLIFPEGTTINDKSRAKSNKFAEKNGMKPARNVLLPRITGLFEAFKALDGNLSGMYDFTVGLSGLKAGDSPEKVFTLRKIFVEGFAPRDIHVRLNYHPIKTIPHANIDEFGEWLREKYYDKEALLEEFYAKGSFPGTGRIVHLPLCPRRYSIFVAVGTLFSLLSFFAWWKLFSFLFTATAAAMKN